MELDMGALPASSRYKIMTSTITPRPIAWVTTRSADGQVNAAPFSFFNAMGGDPPTVVLGMMRRADASPKDTAANILATGEFVVNLVGEPDSAAMNITCIDAPPGVDETVLAGLSLVPSSLVTPPRIATAPVSFECKLVDCVYPGGKPEGQMIVVGEVIIAHIDDRFILDRERLHFDTPAMQLIGRMHGAGWYARTSDLFQLERPSWQKWQAENGG
jgi:flavin reductase (DIM6/NTAB) family NADH-FMN oxidoreductase RutF